MKKRKMVLIMILTLVLVTIAGCSTKKEETKEGTKSETKSETKSGANMSMEDIRVALLIPGPPTDGGFCQVGSEALLEVEKETGCEVTIVEAATADKMKSEAEALADEGYNIIFGHGGQFSSPFAEICEDYTDTLFVTLGGSEVRDNLYPIQAKLEDCTYMAGVIAAQVSKTNKIGLIVGGDFPAYTKTTRAFEMGAKSINPDIEAMFVVLTNVDMNEAYETALSQINSGADVLYCNANQATLGALKAAKEKDVYIFGSQGDMSSEAPDQVIASCIQDFVSTYQAVLENYADGSIEPGIQEVGIEEGAVGFIWNEDLRKTLPKEVQGVYEEYSPKIISDEIDLPGEND